MAKNRREFLQLATAAAGGALGLGLTGCRPAGEPQAVETVKPLRILILGGTGFIGPHIVEYALSRGHTLTLFNRGKTNTHLFPEVERLKGDRDNDLESLKGREWDVVIDNSASLPRWVRQSAGLLKDAAQLYLFTSSISVYASFSTPGLTEDAPLGTLEDPSVEEVTGETFGPLKALAEQEAQKAFGDRALIVRPGLIVGPMDNSDRFTYWPVRIDRGGEVMAPGDSGDTVQFIDARDLAAWYVHLVEQGTTGVFHATGPEKPMPMGEMLSGIQAAIGADVTFTWVDAEFLAQHEVAPWMHMTVWIPPEEGYEGFSKVDCSKALAQGLTFRPLADTVRDTLAWWYALPEERRAKPRAGLPPEREAEVLAAWHARDEAAEEPKPE